MAPRTNDRSRTGTIRRLGWLPLALIALAVPAAGRASAAAATSVTPAYGTYAWPVHGPVIRGFEAPTSPYSAGHRGIDIGAPFGSPMVAAQSGVVSFAGWVGGSLYISIDHPDGVRTTYSWISAVSVKKGEHVAKGQRVGATGHGHPDVPTPHLHFGARIGSDYIDPITLLGGANVVDIVHLAPLDGSAASATAAYAAFRRPGWPVGSLVSIAGPSPRPTQPYHGPLRLEVAARAPPGARTTFVQWSACRFRAPH